MFSIITPAFLLVDFYTFIYQWKQEEILYKIMTWWRYNCVSTLFEFVCILAVSADITFTESVVWLLFSN